MSLILKKFLHIDEVDEELYNIFLEDTNRLYSEYIITFLKLYLKNS